MGSINTLNFRFNMPTNNSLLDTMKPVELIYCKHEIEFIYIYINIKDVAFIKDLTANWLHKNLTVYLNNNNTYHNTVIQ